MHSFQRNICIAVVSSLIVFCCVQGLSNSCAAGSADKQYAVGVYYYPWYDDDFHGGNYLRQHLVPPQLPQLGEYNDRGPAVIEQHIQWCENAGIDFWVASWWGPSSREDVTLKTYILPKLVSRNIKIAAFYETAGRTNDFTDYSRIVGDIADLAHNYFAHPNYLRIGGKPVLFVYLTRVLSQHGELANQLTAMRNAASAAGYDLFIAGDQVFGAPPANASEIALLDAITNYDVYGSTGASAYAGQAGVDSYFGQQAAWKALANSVNVNFIPAVSPGFNDKGVRPGHAALARKLSPGGTEGSLFRAMLRGAKPLTDPALGHMLLVTSWNEWHEDTQIEPVASAAPAAVDDSVTSHSYTEGLEYPGYGTLYLDILAEETFPATSTTLPNPAQSRTRKNFE